MLSETPPFIDKGPMLIEMLFLKSSVFDSELLIASAKPEPHRVLNAFFEVSISVPLNCDARSDSPGKIAHIRVISHR